MDQSAALAAAAAAANGLMLQSDWDHAAQAAAAAAMAAPAGGCCGSAHGDCWGNQWPAATGGAEGCVTAYGYGGGLCSAWPLWEESSAAGQWPAAACGGSIGEVPQWTATLPGVLPPDMEEDVANMTATGDVPPGLAAAAAHDSGEHGSPVQLLLSGTAGIGVSCY